MPKVILHRFAKAGPLMWQLSQHQVRKLSL